jgi:hypothetical protein
MKILTFGKYLNKTFSYYDLQKAVSKIRSRTPLRVATLPSIGKPIIRQEPYTDLTALIDSYAKSEEPELSYRVEFNESGNWQRAGYRRRSLGDLFRLTKTYFPEVTVSDLIVFLHKYYNQWYCYNAEKRVWSTKYYTDWRKNSYHVKTQPTQKDEYGMTIKDWERMNQILRQRGHGKNLK